MKAYKPDKGWLVKCLGGPLDQNFIRTYAVKRVDGEWQDTNMDWDFRVAGHPEGRYILHPTELVSGQRKTVKHKGVAYDAWHYEWTTE